MATFSKLTLQPAGVTSTGLAIRVAATASPGTAIHTSSNVATVIDEIWLYAMNTDAASRKLTIQWGENTSPDGEIELTIASESGLVLVIPGLVLRGNATPKVIRAFAASANVVTIHGYVNRITE